MKKRRQYSPEEQAKLMATGKVLKVNDITITYRQEFKVEAVRTYLQGRKTPQEIFIEAGFDLGMIGVGAPRRCLHRWKEVVMKYGEHALYDELRGKHSTGCAVDRELTIEEQLRRAEAKIKYLEQENDLLKKFDRLEGSVVSKPADRFRIIHDLISSNEAGLNVAYLCEIADVSRSGYYRWLRRAVSRDQRELRDQEQRLWIEEIFLRKHRKAGWRTIKMELERQNILMNHKKIRRLMIKFGLVTLVRRKNPYKHKAKATEEHRTMPNVLAREFKQTTPYHAFGTDITYLRSGYGGRHYLSILRDMASAEVVAYRVSTSYGMELATEVIEKAVEKLGKQTLKGAIIHSDQGVHYTHPGYISKLASLEAIQSMSRKANCIDNAPTESFFGHLKDELDLTHCRTEEEVQLAVATYIDYYNNHRYQWTRKRMAPVEFRNHLLTA